MPRNKNDEVLIISSTTGAQEQAITLDNSAVTGNATNTVTISSVAPAAVGTATISKWLTVNISGVAYYIPMWT